MTKKYVDLLLLDATTSFYGNFDILSFVLKLKISKRSLKRRGSGKYYESYKILRIKWNFVIFFSSNKKKVIEIIKINNDEEQSWSQECKKPNVRKISIKQCA